MKLGKQDAILRNELMSRQGKNPILIEQDRAQRTSLILKDVAYWLEADIVLRPRATDPVFKYRDQFNRRVERGQYNHVPYLGTREFAAFFSRLDEQDRVAPIDMEIGTMLFDLAYVEDASRPEMTFIRHDERGSRVVSGYAQPLFFQARVENGWMNIPREKYDELYRLEGGHAV